MLRVISFHAVMVQRVLHRWCVCLCSVVCWRCFVVLVGLQRFIHVMLLFVVDNANVFLCMRVRLAFFCGCCVDLRTLCVSAGGELEFKDGQGVAFRISCWWFVAFCVRIEFCVFAFVELFGVTVVCVCVAVIVVVFESQFAFVAWRVCMVALECVPFGIPNSTSEYPR